MVKLSLMKSISLGVFKLSIIIFWVLAPRILINHLYCLLNSPSLLRISNYDSNQLCFLFSIEKLTYVVSNLSKGKSPSPDGFTGEFYFNLWYKIKLDFLAFMNRFHSNPNIPKSWGPTHLIFIPKHQSPTSIKDYRPMSLYNVSYRILSKVIADRLKTDPSWAINFH